jgi:hypothetical protein
MSRVIAIEINDAELTVAGDGRVLAAEPGFALVDGREIVTGHPAYAQSRLKPRLTSNSHWSKLSMAPDSATIAGTGSTAELAFVQLRSIWRQFESETASVMLIVPSNWSDEQLGIVLGLAQECRMPVSGLVDAAAAASIRPYPGRQLIYVDAGLHEVTVTPLAQSDEVTAEPAERLASSGLAGVMDQFAQRIAEAFVLATRFDPLHEAATEQLLYNALPGWLDQLHTNEAARAELPFRDEVFAIELDRSQLLAAAKGFYKALLQLIAQSRRSGVGLAVQLSDRIATLPGVLGELGRLDDAVIVAHQPGHAAIAALDAQALLAARGTEVKLYRHLPWRGEASADAAPVRVSTAVLKRSTPVPTHIVYRGIAYPVNGAGLVIGRSRLDERAAILLDDEVKGVSRSHCEISLVDGELRLRDVSSHGTFVNERRIDGDEVLRPADVIRVGTPGAELTAVVVGDNDGS